jgi:hypothetical protein
MLTEETAQDSAHEDHREAEDKTIDSLYLYYKYVNWSEIPRGYDGS